MSPASLPVARIFAPGSAWAMAQNKGGKKKELASNKVCLSLVCTCYICQLFSRPASRWRHCMGHYRSNSSLMMQSSLVTAVEGLFVSIPCPEVDCSEILSLKLRT